MDTKRKIAVVLILAGFFLPILLYPLSISYPPGDELIGKVHERNSFDAFQPYKRSAHTQNELENFLARTISTGEPGALYVSLRLVVTFSVFVSFIGILILFFSFAQSKNRARDPDKKDLAYKEKR